jgi:spermidine synthase
MIASKADRNLEQFRKAGANSKTFTTKYYSADVHEAALVYPPYMQEALGED